MPRSLPFHILPHEPRFIRAAAFLCLLLIGISLEILVHFTFGISIVYTHFFYLLLVLAGLWFHQRAVYLAVLFALTHIGVQYVLSGGFTPDTFLRGAMFIIVTYVVGTVAKRLEERNIELEDANRRLAVSEQAFLVANRKLNLLSSITRHDILNQVTSLFGYLTLAREGEEDPGRNNYLRKAEECAVTIRQQIAFTREYQDVGVHAPRWQSLTQSIHGYIGSSGTRGVEIIEPSVDYEILADPLLPRIFFNLIDNSIRHGERVTRILFSVHKSGDGLVIRCEDNGIGVPNNEKERIFEAGFGKNTGFGLFLSREILSITGIEISETGIPGKGASFTIYAPNGTFRPVRGDSGLIRDTNMAPEE